MIKRPVKLYQDDHGWGNIDGDGFCIHCVTKENAEQILTALNAQAAQAARIEELEQAEKALKEAYELLDAVPEINMSNFNEDDVRNLNNLAIEVYGILGEALSGGKCKTCGGSGQIGEEEYYQGRSVGWKACPDCQGGEEANDD